MEKRPTEREQENYLARIQTISLEIAEDRLRRIRAIVDQHSDERNAPEWLLEIEEILREMDYDNY